MAYTKTFANGAGAETSTMSAAQRALGWICGQLDIGQFNQIQKEVFEDIKEVNDRVDTISNSLGGIDFKDDFIQDIAFNPVNGKPDTREMVISYAPTGDEQVTDIRVQIAGFTFRGMMTPFHGSAADIPDGWQICNGTNGTPNLVDRFIMGRGAATTNGETGGASTKTTSASGAHSHTASGRTGATSLSIAQLPPHGHGVDDPGHAHSYKDKASSGSFELDDGNDLFVPTSHPDNTRTTVASTTGITVQQTGSGQGHDHSVSLTTGQAPNHTHTVSTLPPYYKMAWIMKL